MNTFTGISEQVRRDAAEGRLSKQALAELLVPERRGAFLAACAVIEKKFTADCTATHDPCLESGCALEGETCLQPLQRAEAESQRAFGAEWIKFVH